MKLLKTKNEKSSFEILPLIQMICAFAVVIVEEPGNGLQKKKKALEIIKEFLKNFKLPIPETIINFILPFLIDKIVDILNKSIWK